MRCMLHGACCLLHVARCMLCVVRCMVQIACCALHGANCMLSVASCTMHVARCNVVCCMSAPRAGASGCARHGSRPAEAFASRGPAPRALLVEGSPVSGRRRADAKPGVGPVQSPASGRCKAWRRAGAKPGVCCHLPETLRFASRTRASAQHGALSHLSARGCAPVGLGRRAVGRMPQYRCASGCIRRASAVPAAGSTARTRPSRQR